MKNLALTAIAAALAFSAPTFADDAHHPEKAQESKAAPAKPAAKIAPAVQKMQAQLERVAGAKTDEERQTAMAEHMQTMQENMKLTRGMKAAMTDCPMMQGGMMGGAMAGGGGMGMMGEATPPSGPAERMRQMEKRMDMMQMMMEHMMRRQEATQPAPSK